MSARPLLRLLLVPSLLVLAACTGNPAARSFAPAGEQDVRDALTGWSAAEARADGLSASRLLYDAHMGKGGAAPLPGTLAVRYDGERVLSANLTGPFGARVADYSGGAVTGQDKKAFVIDPEVLRSVLAGIWRGTPASVAGRDGDDVLLKFDGPYRVEAVVDLKANRVRSLQISGEAGRLEVSYSGRSEPWPQDIALRDVKSGRSLVLALIAVEPAQPAAEPHR